MALFEDVLKGSWGAALVGVGVALVAPTVLPAVGAALRPLAKSAIKGGVMLYDTVKESIAEAGEQVTDMVAEVRAEVEEESEETGESSRRRARSRKGSE
jgi:predicted tellurium resistance membrane protein TerC